MFAAPRYVPSPEETDAILEFLPVFERDDFEPSTVHSPPGQMPAHLFSDELRRFHQAVYDNGFVVDFNWLDWQEEGNRYYERPELLRDADIHVLQKLITVHVRLNRFADGHLSGVVKDGHMVKVLRRLKEIQDERTSASDDRK